MMKLWQFILEYKYFYSKYLKCNDIVLINLISKVVKNYIGTETPDLR